jgi:hypothetical protein
LLRRACAKLRFETTGEGACETFDGEKPKQAQGQTKGIATDDMTSGKLNPLHAKVKTEKTMNKTDQIAAAVWDRGGQLGIATVFSIRNEFSNTYFQFIYIDLNLYSSFFSIFSDEYQKKNINDMSILNELD